MRTLSDTTATRIRELRKQRGMTQQGLAQRVKMLGAKLDQTAIAKIESGKRRVLLEEAFQLAWALDVAPVHLFVPTDDDKPIALGPNVGSKVQASPYEIRAWIRGGRFSRPDTPRRCARPERPFGLAPAYFTREHLLSLFTRAPKAAWRFDVDFSLDAAVRMAEFAETAGVKGTFYILGTGSEYNPFSLAGVRAIERIAAHGHRVGMHVDERDGPNAYVAAKRSRDLFARRFEGVMDVRLVSFHMPTEHVLWRDFVLLESAYAPRWKGRYVADSRREWDADKEARLVADGGEGIQCNLHPEHWFGGC